MNITFDGISSDISSSELFSWHFRIISADLYASATVRNVLEALCFQVVRQPVRAHRKFVNTIFCKPLREFEFQRIYNFDLLEDKDKNKDELWLDFEIKRPKVKFMTRLNLPKKVEA